MGKITIALSFLLLSFLSLSNAMYKHETLTAGGSGNWIPVARFWFDANHSSTDMKFNFAVPEFNWTIVNSADLSGNTKLLIYDDESKHWGEVSSGSLSCQQKINYANTHGIINITQNGQAEINPIDESHERHWYVVIANCEGPIDVTYQFQFLNPGGFYTRQFSVDQQGFWAVYLTFFLFYMFVVAALGYIVFVLYRTGSWTLIVKLFTVVVVLYFFQCMFALIHYDQFARDGEGSPGCLFFSQMLTFAAHWIFIGMLILIARGALSSSGGLLTERRNMIIILGSLLLLDVIWFIWRSVIFHGVLHPYFVWGTAPGILMLIIRCFVLVYFVIVIRYTMLTESDPDKRTFYFRFAILGGFWLAVLPILVMLVAAVDAASRPYDMDRGVEVPWILFTFLITVFIQFYYFWPSRIAAHFDFSKSDVLVGSASSPYETL